MTEGAGKVSALPSRPQGWPSCAKGRSADLGLISQPRLPWTLSDLKDHYGAKTMSRQRLGPCGPSVPGKVLSGSRSLVTKSLCVSSPGSFNKKESPRVFVRNLLQDLGFWFTFSVHPAVISFRWKLNGLASSLLLIGLIFVTDYLLPKFP